MMANIIIPKERMYALIQTKNGLVKKEVRASSSDYKIKDRMTRTIKKSIHFKNKIDGTQYSI